MMLTQHVIKQIKRRKLLRVMNPYPHSLDIQRHVSETADPHSFHWRPVKDDSNNRWRRSAAGALKRAPPSRILANFGVSLSNLSGFREVLGLSCFCCFWVLVVSFRWLAFSSWFLWCDVLGLFWLPFCSLFVVFFVAFSTVFWCFCGVFLGFCEFSWRFRSCFCGVPCCFCGLV